MGLIAQHRFTESIGGRFCTDCGVSWRAVVEQRERWKSGEEGLVCKQTRGLYSYEVLELEEAYQQEVAAVTKAFGW